MRTESKPTNPPPEWPTGKPSDGRFPYTSQTHRPLHEYGITGDYLLPPKSTALLPFREAAANSGQRLQVAVVLGGSRPVPWVNALLSFLKQLPGIDVHPINLPVRSLRASEQPSWLTDRLYSASRKEFDPFGDITDGGTGSADSECVEAIRTAGYGVLIWLAHWKDINLDLGGLVKHGAFTVRWGKRDSAIPFWEELVNNRVTSTVTIYWHESSFTHGRAVRMAETSTVQGINVTRNASEPVAAVIRMLANLCLDMRDGGLQFQERLRCFPVTQNEALLPAGYPNMLESGKFILKRLARSSRLRFKNLGKENIWFLAVRPNSGASIIDLHGLDLPEFREVPRPPGSRWMCDPFLWDKGESTYLLFEDVPVGSSRGRIGCVEVFENGSCSEMEIILEQPYHLSYPCVVPDRGELFLLPESSEAGRVDLYRFARFPFEVELVAPLVEGLGLLDTTPIFLNDRWYFFTATVGPFVETLLFWSDRLDGPWNLHPCSPISCSVKNSRSAGNLFWRNGRLYRPTQDGSLNYGYAIRVNEVIRLTPTDFLERPVHYLLPTWRSGLRGTHTWNESSRLQVLDGLRLMDRVAARRSV